MPRQDRAPSVQFYPADWMSDPAVLALSWEERGRYHWSWCCSLQTETPGVATEDQWRRWMGYSQDEWGEHSTAHAACFRIGRDGLWHQKRTEREREAQRIRHERASKGARVTNEARKSSFAVRTSKRPLGAVAPSSSSSSSYTGASHKNATLKHDLPDHERLSSLDDLQHRVNTVAAEKRLTDDQRRRLDADAKRAFLAGLDIDRAVGLSLERITDSVTDDRWTPPARTTPPAAPMRTSRRDETARHLEDVEIAAAEAVPMPPAAREALEQLGIFGAPSEELAPEDF